jgi:prickle
MLEQQLPPHDSDPKYCRSLNEDEKNELRIFNEQQRHNALGRASARQLPLTQSPMPCRGVCHFLLNLMNTRTSYETTINS